MIGTRDTVPSGCVWTTAKLPLPLGTITAKAMRLLYAQCAFRAEALAAFLAYDLKAFVRETLLVCPRTEIRFYV